MNRTHQAIAQGILSGLTAKETAFQYGVALRSLQNQASKLRVSFPWGGVGHKPTPSKLAQSVRWAEAAATISQPKPTQTK